MTVMEGLEHLCHEERLRELGLPGLEQVLREVVESPSMKRLKSRLGRPSQPALGGPEGVGAWQDKQFSMKLFYKEEQFSFKFDLLQHLVRERDFERDLERDLDAALLGGDSERALADGCCCGELERDLLLDLDLDLASPLPFSLGDRDLDLDLDRDFSDFSLDLL
ncbi:hypothetical protein BTVI_150565 [Pitangus sulphuratus]|nr:hypothetical protein BTVI_150565 [Pitangus sulphuratus]